MPLITLITDFGTQDAFVGVVKGVLKSLSPSTETIDLTHHIPPQDVRAAAFVLKTAYRFFPPGTIHLAVVDPGVGSSRRAVAARIGDFFFVCPDNGLLSYVLAGNALRQAVVLDNPRFHRPSVSRTFHGRDIFAPAAAYLANGVPLQELGTPVDALATFPLPSAERIENTVICHVLYVDVFGNVFLDLTEDVFQAWERSLLTIPLPGAAISGLSDSYSDAPLGSALALFGSSGHLEIAVRNGDAARQFGLAVGASITLRLR